MMDLSEEDDNEFNQLKLILQEIQPCLEIEDEFIWWKHCNEFSVKNNCATLMESNHE